eukprot:m.9046 g.9046  ORF g.9046 m.9046 type:complete len:610 (+) comp3998_c0_seq1:232-2061(+)
MLFAGKPGACLATGLGFAILSFFFYLYSGNAFAGRTNIVSEFDIETLTPAVENLEHPKLHWTTKLSSSRVNQQTKDDSVDYTSTNVGNLRVETTTLRSKPATSSFITPQLTKKELREAWRHEIIRLKPIVNHCAPAKSNNSWKAVASKFVYLGCFVLRDTENNELNGEAHKGTKAECIGKCSLEKFAIIQNHGFCSCAKSLGTLKQIPNSICEEPCEGPSCKDTTKFQVYRIGAWPPYLPSNVEDVKIPEWMQIGKTPGHNTTITIILWANPRLAAIFRTCRLAMYSSRFQYDVYDLRHQARVNNETQVAKLFELFPGPKIIVFDACCVPGWLLMKWPKYTALVVASDESAKWGFTNPSGKGDNVFGPHGPNGLVPSDANKRIIMPQVINPWFKQYYSMKHVQHFGNNVRFMPLGSREEFQEVLTYKPPSQRKYLYSFMGAPTDISRKKVSEILKKAKGDTIPEDRAFLYMAEHWDANPNSDRNTYIKPGEYRKIMMESIFTPCPKGHSIEQFRFYEAIESGSIPIVAMEGSCPGGCPGYAKERLPPEYLSSPIVVIQDWDEVVDKMLELEKQPEKLLERQTQLKKWYTEYMHNKITEMEDIVLEKIKD